jgi:hypothetical protein
MGYTINTITGKTTEERTVISTGRCPIRKPSLIAQFFAKLKKHLYC